MTETVDRLPLTSQDILQDRLAVLRETFPEVFREGKVDFDALRQALGETVDTGPERYGLSWAGKADAIRNIQTPSIGTLVPDREESVDFDSTRNLFIEGDNLEVLKLLQKAYYGKVKMIYIDPPYNTGGEFIYPDDFKEGLETYLRYSRQVTEEGVKITTNTETSGRYHSKWLDMMYPRLFLARNLLREDGVIFVSIDDHEVHNLRMLLNETFGEENFIAELVWEGAIKNDSRFVSISHDYILCFARSKEHLRTNNAQWRTRKEGIDAIYAKVADLTAEYPGRFDKITEGLRAWYREIDKRHPAWQHRHYSKVDSNGVYFPSDISWPGGGGPMYEVLHPVTGKPVRVPARGWVFPSAARMQEAISQGKVDFGADETKVPTLKRYLMETEGQVLPSVFYQDRRAAMQRLRDLFGAEVFDNPKDETVLMKLVEATTTGDDLILDFFAGSCTTAHAVLAVNQSDGGNRRFMMVQLPEPTGNSDFPTIADIGKERIRRVIQKLQAESDSKLPLDGSKQEDLGFRVYKLAESNFRVWDPTAPETPEQLERQLEMHVDHIRPEASQESILAEILLKSGFELTAPVRQVTAGGATCYSVADGLLLVCLEGSVTEEAIRAMIALGPEQVVCLDSAFHGNDQLKTNTALQMKDAGITFHTV